jgi:hypothetical protein
VRGASAAHALKKERGARRSGSWMESSSGVGFPSRHPIALRVAILCAVIAFGLVGQHLLGAYLARIEELSHTNVLEARAALALVFEVVSVSVFGLTGLTGVTLLLALRRGFAVGQFPPPGMWSWGARRTFTGPAARRLSQLGVVLAICLVLASCAGGGLTWYMASVLRACRAGVVEAPAQLPS